MPKKASDWEGCENITAIVTPGWGRGHRGSSCHCTVTAWPGVLLPDGASIWKAERIPPSLKGPEQEFRVK